MFVRLAAFALGALVVAVLALGLAHPSSGGGREARYAVRAGDTLWSIATQRYAGDPRRGIWVIRERNGLDTGLIRPGQVLLLPP